MCSKWLVQCRAKPGLNADLSKVCSDHFLPNDYDKNYKEELRNPQYRRTLNKAAIPTQLLEGMEVTIVDLCNIENKEMPPYDEIKYVVDENLVLKERLENLQRERHALIMKKVDCDKRLSSKRARLKSIQNQYSHLKLKSNFIKSHKNLLSRVFSEAQVNVLLEKKKVVWSNDDLAMAFSLRHMGGRECYLYLKHTLNVPLPPLSCVQKWTASNGSI